MLWEERPCTVLLVVYNWQNLCFHYIIILYILQIQQIGPTYQTLLGYRAFWPHASKTFRQPLHCPCPLRWNLSFLAEYFLKWRERNNKWNNGMYNLSVWNPLFE